MGESRRTGSQSRQGRLAILHGAKPRAHTGRCGALTRDSAIRFGQLPTTNYRFFLYSRPAMIAAICLPAAAFWPAMRKSMFTITSPLRIITPEPMGST